MTNKKKLISYNTIKHPLVAQFFDELEDTYMASHYVREAIEFYQQHKNNLATQTTGAIQTPPVSPVAPSNGAQEENATVTPPEGDSGVTEDSEDNYSDFDPNSFR